MPRSLWTGTISFGLVNIPVKLFTAVKDRSVHFHLLSPDGTCRLHQKLYCRDSGEEFEYGQTVRGYEVEPGKYVVIEPEQIQQLKPQGGKVIDIKDFVKVSEVDPFFMDHPYIVVPAEHGRRSYLLLLNALNQTKRVAIAKFVMRSREYLALLRPTGNMLGLETMRFSDEVVRAGEISELAELSRAEAPAAREMKVAIQLVESMTSKFKPGAYHDEYRERLLNLVEEKSKGKKVVIHAETGPEVAPVIDLMDTLRKSLKKVSSNRTRKPRKKAA